MDHFKDFQMQQFLFPVTGQEQMYWLNLLSGSQITKLFKKNMLFNILFQQSRCVFFFWLSI